METRRNLEIIYKRQLEDAENKRFQMELQLMTLKNYMTISEGDPYGEVNKNDDDSHAIFDEFNHRVNNLLQEFSARLKKTSEKNDDLSKIYHDALSISKLEIYKIDFIPQSKFLSSIITFIKMNMSLGSNDIEVSLNERVCINTDINMLCKILRGLSKMFVSRAFDIIATISHDSGSNMLDLKFTEKNNKLFLLKDSTNAVDFLLNQSQFKRVPLNDEIVTFFICKSLSQNMGGDITLEDSNMILSVPCDIMEDGDKCAAPIPAPISTWVPSVAPPSSVPISPPPPPPVPVPSPPVPVPILSPVPTVIDVEPGPPSTTVTASEKSIKGKTLNILLAEDDGILRQVFKKFWTRKEPNVNVFTAADGVEAVNMFKKQRFSIIFLDIDMPLKNGLDASTEMRAYERDNKLKPTPIIGVSGFQIRQYKEKAMEAGMNDFISKGTGYQMKDIYKIVVDYCGD